MAQYGVNMMKENKIVAQASPISFAAMALTLLLLSGCATPESRVRSGLVEAGVPRPVASCMAERMVDRLSLLQLRRIGRLSDLREANARQMSVEQLLRRSRALQDPEIWAVVSTSAAICALRQ